MASISLHGLPPQDNLTLFFAGVFDLVYIQPVKLCDGHRGGDGGAGLAAA